MPKEKKQQGKAVAEERTKMVAAEKKAKIAAAGMLLVRAKAKLIGGYEEIPGGCVEEEPKAAEGQGDVYRSYYGSL